MLFRSLRADNADLRLSQKAIELNLLKEKRKKLFVDYKKSIEKCRSYLYKITLGPHEAEKINLNLSKDGKKRSLYELIGFESLNIRKLKESYLSLNNINPEVGFGVVGKNTVTREPRFIFCLISPKVSVEINATAQTPFLGYSTRHGCLKFVPSGLKTA